MSHFTVAVSENAVQKLFREVRDTIHLDTSGNKSFGAFSASWNIGIRLQGGTVDLQNNGSILISELDVVYDPVIVKLGVNIPEVCVGGFCLIPNLWGGCLVRAPRICIFSANPDITLPLNLSNLVHSEISGAFGIARRYYTSPLRAGGASYLDAEDAGQPNQWQFFLDPVWLDIDPIDIADTVGNILDAAITNAINTLLGWLPGWARDLLGWLLGGIVGVVRDILDIVDDVSEWLSNLLGVSVGLLDFLATMVADKFASRNPILSIEEPYPILGYNGPLIPVKVRIENVGVSIQDKEMIVKADVGVL